MRSDINFNHLECFIVVSRTQSFSKAAEELKIAQPAVSKQIKSLEEKLGGQLFIRTRKNVHLTEMGMELYNRTASLFGAICEEVLDLQSEGKEISGKIRVGLLSEVGERVFVAPISEFKKKYPKIIININFLKSHEIIEKVKNGELDIGITPEKVIQENIRSYEIFKEEIILVTSMHSKSKVTNIADLPFVTYRDNDPLLHFYLKKTSPRLSHAKINIQMTVNSHRSMAKLLLDHPYYAVLPRLSVEEELKENSLVQVNNKGLESKLYLMVRDFNIPDRKIEMLKSYISQYLKEHY